MSSRKEMREAARLRVAQERQQAKDRKAELAQLPDEERQAAQAADKAAAKQQRKERKAERKQARSQMSRAERRQDKKQERIYRKVKNRRRRMAGWGVATAVVVILAVVAAPYVSDIRRLLSIDVNTSTAEGEQARNYGAEIAEQLSDEGIVLLKNEENLLPLAAPEVNVFSFAAYNLRYGGGGSGGADQSRSITLFDAFTEHGISYNPQLDEVMAEAGAETTADASPGLAQIIESFFTDKEDTGEPAPDYLTDEVLKQAKEYSDTALLVIGNDGVETQDFTIDQLQLTDNQRQLFDKVTATFDDVIVVVNSGNQMELGFLDDYPQIKSALWIGTPGPLGAVSLAKILTGEVNPSGHLTNTYAYDVTSAPAAENLGDYKYSNADRAFLNYSEGIYVGYRYYETRYQDDDAAYRQAVQFPFGHGLSYTSFDWQATEPQISGEEITVEVTVTNTGDRAGKDVVQAYVSPPYTDGGIEKSAVVLTGFAKTKLLEPGESETVSITWDRRDMASWDSAGEQAYVLEAGTYQIRLSENVHHPVAEFEYDVAETEVFDTDDVTGTPLQNQFEYAQGDLTYLSRSDWEGTYPDDSTTNYEASPEVLAALERHVEPIDGPEPVFGVDHGLKLADLQGLDYDDPLWDQFVEQFTLDELIDLFSRGAWQTTEVERLGVPSTILLDGPAGLNFFFGDVTAASFPTEVVIASTWNEELAFTMGEAIGQEANAYGVQGWYAPGMNLHRTAQGGRNFEYYSEDPYVSGVMGAAMTAGAQSKDVVVFMKHFVLNDQEINARSGINIWTNEQALRELYLKPFEMTVKDGGAQGAMSSFVHLGTTWAGGNEQLLENVLREEWGFTGVVSSDAVLGAFMDPVLAVRNGNDLMLNPLPTNNIRKLKAAYSDDPVGIAEGLRERAHNITYAVLQTDHFTQ